MSPDQNNGFAPAAQYKVETVLTFATIATTDPDSVKDDEVILISTRQDQNKAVLIGNYSLSSTHRSRPRDKAAIRLVHQAGTNCNEQLSKLPTACVAIQREVGCGKLDVGSTPCMYTMTPLPP